MRIRFRGCSQVHLHFHTPPSTIPSFRTILEGCIDKIQNQLTKLLDLYLEGSFLKEVLNDWKPEVDSDLRRWIGANEIVLVSDSKRPFRNDSIEVIKSIYSEIRDALGHVTV
jgi:hypothetical protein